jgi:nuclear transport factor 2 (NTF2) superfamily protein
MVSSITVRTVSLQGFHWRCQNQRKKVWHYIQQHHHLFVIDAIKKIRIAEDNWNSRNPEKVALAYTLDSRWRNRAEFVNGRQEIVAFLTRKWTRELDYRLIKELWAFTYDRIAVRFAYEWHDDSGNWFRSYGNENWEFDESGLMRVRLACINDLSITESERKYRWHLGPRPDGHPGLTELGF